MLFRIALCDSPVHAGASRVALHTHQELGMLNVQPTASC